MSFHSSAFFNLFEIPLGVDVPILNIMQYKEVEDDFIFQPIYVVCEDPLNDNQWHTFYIKRRANYLEAYVDDCTKASSEMDHLFISLKLVSSTLILFLSLLHK